VARLRGCAVTPRSAIAERLQRGTLAERNARRREASDENEVAKPPPTRPTNPHSDPNSDTH